MPSRPNPIIARLAALSLAVLLAGCAAQMAYRDGKDLVAQDRIELALLKFREALYAEPNNAEYRAAYAQTRERAVIAWLQQAEALAAAGRKGEAEAMYQRVLTLDPENLRARAGLNADDAARRHAQLLREAQAAIERQDAAGAQGKLDTILAENSAHAQALALKRSLAEQTARPPSDPALATAFKKPISIEFRDAQLRQVFEVIAMSSGLNFVFDKDVKTDQKTSIFLKNSTVESAIYMLLVTNQLEQQVLDNNTILIYPNVSAKQKEYQELVVKSFFLANADAKTVANTIKTIVKSRDVVVDEKLNMVIMRDSPEAVRIAEKLVVLHDSPEPEVMLEVEVLEVQRSRLMELGIQWPSSMALTPLSATGGGTLTVNDLRHLNRNTIGAGVSPVVINARKQDGDSNILANPRIRARNHEKAKIMIGDRVPNITTTIGTGSTSFISESINYVDIGLKLEVEPTIYLDNDVAIRIGLEVSSIVNQLQTKSGTVAYQIGTRNASTVLRLKDGENQILAGLISDEERKTANKLPGLGDLPLIGRLFGSSLDNNQKTEIVLSITPRLIRNIQRPLPIHAEFRSGTDTSFRNAPAPGSNRLTLPAVITAPQAAMPVPATQTPALPQAVPPAAAPVTPAAPATPAGGAPASGASGKAVFMQFMGPNLLKVGDPFDLQLVMESRQPVSGLSMSIGYDDRVLQVVGVTEGDFLKQGGAQTSFSSQVEPAGKLTLKGARIGAAAGAGAGSAGSVATLNFRAIAPTEGTRLQLLGSAPTDAAGAAIATPTLTPHVLRIQK